MKKHRTHLAFLCASPRKNGNTHTLVDWAIAGATAAGATAEKIDLTRLKYKSLGCVACMGCQKSREFKCVIRDGAQSVLARLPQADAIVFATPVYFFGPAAQLKVFLDRAFSWFKFNDAAGTSTSALRRSTTLALIASAGGGLRAGLGLTRDTYKILATFTRCTYKTLLVPNAPAAQGALKSNAALRRKAEAFGRRLARGAR